MEILKRSHAEDLIFLGTWHQRAATTQIDPEDFIKGKRYCKDYLEDCTNHCALPYASIGWDQDYVSIFLGRDSRHQTVFILRSRVCATEVSMMWRAVGNFKAR